MGNRPGSSTTYVPLTRLEIAQRDERIAQSKLHDAKNNLARAQNKLGMAEGEVRAMAQAQAKTCNCCPTCGGTR
jgi:hypothetical protein